MTQQEMLTVVSDHIEHGTPIKVVKNGNNDYSVYAECADGLVSVTIKTKSTSQWVANVNEMLK